MGGRGASCIERIEREDTAVQLVNGLRAQILGFELGRETSLRGDAESSTERKCMGANQHTTSFGAQLSYQG